MIEEIEEPKKLGLAAAIKSGITTRQLGEKE